MWHGDRDRYCYHVTMELELGSQSRTSESLSGWLCVRCPMSQVNITPGSHMVTLGIGLCNVHLWFSLNWTSSLLRSLKAICLLRRNVTAWWLMVSGRDSIWQGLSTCVNPTCVTCLGSVSGITSTPTSHCLLSFSSRRKTGPQLYLDTEIMETLGLGCLDARHLSLYSLFSLRILKFQCNHVQSCVKNQLSVFVYACLLRRECQR